MKFLIDKANKHKSGIYKIRNLVNDKVYIGSAVRLYDRYRTHKSKLALSQHSNKRLLASVSKHGLENFSFELLELCEKKELVAREQYWIDLYNACIDGYNIRTVAQSNIGVRRSAESNKKTVATRRANGWPISNEHRRLMSKALKGRVFSAETIAKMKIAAKNRMENPDTRKKISNSHRGIKLSDQHKLNIQNSLRRLNEINPDTGKPYNIEMRQKASVRAKELGLKPPSPKGRIISEETRRRLSIWQKGKVLTPDRRAQVIEAGKKGRETQKN